MPLPVDYVERVYAGILGKIIGVYLGRPFEGWTYEKIIAELGEVWYYVHAQRGVPLVVADDDIAGTFTFLRALQDHGGKRSLTPRQIGQTWLNYLVEKQSVLWWGGLGNSTEHTAYLRLKHGIPAPESGSISVNSKTVAEQIGAQIFIDGWAMVAPGDPELAAALAKKAGSVSHDGEALYGAQVLAAMESLAFVESNIQRLIDAALTFIPQDSIIARMITDLRQWRAELPDWRDARQRIEKHYGYDRYSGNCHIIPNHALIHLGLLYGDGDFQKSLMICNTSGWDTDCNSGNLGCLMGIRGSLDGIDAGPDWRGPVADRLYMPTADGGRTVTDAVAETFNVVNMGRKLAGKRPVNPKNGARFHFELPGSVQGFTVQESPATAGILSIQNVRQHSLSGKRSLALRYRRLAPGRAARAATATFLPPAELNAAGYPLNASPTLYPGQTVCARLASDDHNGQPVKAALYFEVYGSDDRLSRRYGPSFTYQPGQQHEIVWRIEDTEGYPIQSIGIELTSEYPADGSLFLDYLTWDGAPRVEWTRTAGGTAWRKAWVCAVDEFSSWAEPYRLIQNEGRGMIIQGTREWQDYRLRATVTPHMLTAGGIAARVQGLRRCYALLLVRGNRLRLIKVDEERERTLAETDFPWQFEQSVELELRVQGNHIEGYANGVSLFSIEERQHPFTSGAVALICDEGRLAASSVEVSPE